VMQTACQAYEVLSVMAKDGMESSISDVGVGAMCIRTCVSGACLNVRINAQSLTDEAVRSRLLNDALKAEADSELQCAEILKLVNSKIK